MTSPRAIMDMVIRSGLRLCLYANDREPGPRDEASDYQEPANYAPISLSIQGWEFQDDEAAYPEQELEFFGAAGNVYGYFLTDATGRWIGGERFAEPFEVRIAGDKVQVTPRLAWGASP